MRTNIILLFWLLLLSTAHPVTPQPPTYIANATQPISYRRKSATFLHERTSGTAVIHEMQDMIYTVDLKIGDIHTPLVIDTGSADLWVLSSSCTTCSYTNMTPPMLYPADRLQSTGIDTMLRYGDSRTSTYASGTIGRDVVSVAGFTLQEQYFALINSTSADVLGNGAAGIFGLGFAGNSVLWRTLFASQDELPPHQRRTSLDLLDPAESAVKQHHRRKMQQTGKEDGRPESEDTGLDMLASFSTFGPFATRLVEKAPVRIVHSCNKDNDEDAYDKCESDENASAKERNRHIGAPQLSIVLPRDVPSSFSGPGVEKETGTLTFGFGKMHALSSSHAHANAPLNISQASSLTLPDIDECDLGEDDDMTTWLPVRRYTRAQHGLVAPHALNETYPLAWEVFVDGVWFDGVRVDEPNGRDGDGVSDGHNGGQRESALLDTGNALIRAPQGVVNAILLNLAASHASPPEPPFSSAAIPLSKSTTPPSRATSNGYARSKSMEIGGIRDKKQNDTSSPSNAGAQVQFRYPCTAAHTLSFVFSGRRFDIDPRDFGTPIPRSEITDERSERGGLNGTGPTHNEAINEDHRGEIMWCVPNIAVADVPEVGGWLYSWNLGVPFLKSVIATFYFGNITHPSVDPPRIGLSHRAPANFRCGWYVSAFPKAVPAFIVIF